MQNYCETNAGMEAELLWNKHRNGCEINAWMKCEINAGMNAELLWNKCRNEMWNKCRNGCGIIVK